MITLQWQVKEWHYVIGKKTIADTILDRLTHNSLTLSDIDVSTILK